MKNYIQNTKKVFIKHKDSIIGSLMTIFALFLVISGSIALIDSKENKYLFMDSKCANQFVSDYHQDYNIFYSKKLDTCVIYATLEEANSQRTGKPETRVTYRQASNRDVLYKVLYFDFYYPEKDMFDFYKEKFEQADE